MKGLKEGRRGETRILVLDPLVPSDPDREKSIPLDHHRPVSPGNASTIVRHGPVRRVDGETESGNNVCCRSGRGMRRRKEYCVGTQQDNR